jgi:thioredoxin 1
MAEPIVLTDDNFNNVLLGDKPLLILITNGQNVRGDFSTALKQALEDPKGTVIAQIDPAANPKAAEYFGVSGDKPVLVGWYCGEEVLRRSKPWGTDLPLAFEMLETKVREFNPQTAVVIEPEPVKPAAPVKVADTKPVVVSDETFQTEVIDYHLPVLVDFWAEWCGPCKMVAPTLAKLAAEFSGQIRIAKVNVDENPMLSQNFQIMSIPTIMLIKERTIVFNQPGALPEPAFRDLIKQLIALKLPPREAQDQPAK